MNCAKCQEQIVASLAAGQQCFSTEAEYHLRSCVGCAEYLQSQRELFSSIDAGLHSFVNQPIPPSLLPSVRMRLEERLSIVRNAKFHWQLTAVSAAALLAITVSYVSRVSVLHVSSSPKVVVSERAINDSPAQSTTSALPPSLLSHTNSTKHSNSSVPTHTEPEVIVSAEERQAFVRFVANNPEPAEMAVVFAGPGHEAVQDAAEIALLQIKSLEVKPLDDSASE